MAGEKAVGTTRQGPRIGGASPMKYPAAADAMPPPARGFREWLMLPTHVSRPEGVIDGQTASSWFSVPWLTETRTHAPPVPSFAHNRLPLLSTSISLLPVPVPAITPVDAGVPIVSPTAPSSTPSTATTAMTNNYEWSGLRSTVVGSFEMPCEARAFHPSIQPPANNIEENRTDHKIYSSTRRYMSQRPRSCSERDFRSPSQATNIKHGAPALSGRDISLVKQADGSRKMSAKDPEACTGVETTTGNEMLLCPGARLTSSVTRRGKGDGNLIFAYEQWLPTKMATLGTVVVLPPEDQKLNQRDKPPPNFSFRIAGEAGTGPCEGSQSLPGNGRYGDGARGRER
ncbi:hypothetical protein MAPG_03467 [Magnaporthiopsis poae ATCC 64411]|uniref:Uncharacterized protein n=1 Tax=Magnaporthiopsis poae (strain ATCC 64411 / 73-15) TaxID=644358 RepID=A0A0C4DU33_MAGP6|nr:hypothetical protein MAPG_03467 [Magnaporthiopsis poae ATCC 64411]